MCRGKANCSELLDHRLWSDRGPLPPPQWIRDHLESFYSGVRSAAKSDFAAAVQRFALIPDDEIRNWCIEHGQVSGNFRFRALGKPKGSPPRAGSGPRNIPSRLIASVLERDRCHCRYCGLPVIPREVLTALDRLLGGRAFRFKRKNSERHGAALVSWAQIDHVDPWSRGGATDMENLVTSCWACNYGKAGYEISQIGIADPRLREPVKAAWDGLKSLVPALRSLSLSKLTDRMNGANA